MIEFLIEKIASIFDVSGFMPRWNCGQWTDLHGWIHILSDLAIWGAYFTIPCLLVYLIMKRPDVPFTRLFWLFGAFILACGSGHLIEATIFWHPWYRLSGLVKVITAVVSWWTVIALLPVLPKALSIPGLAKMNADLERQVNERCRAEERLHKTNKELEQFVYTASHDLKSPLITIEGFSGHLNHDVQNGRSDRLGEFAGRIQDGIQKMHNTIDALLEVSRVGRVVNAPEPVAVGALVSDWIADHQEQIAQKGLHLDVQSDLPVIHGDRRALTQIFDNLLTNALKYGSEGRVPRISVGAVREGREVRLFVKDNGPGIEAAYHEKIFELFERLHNDDQGTGIGLALVRRSAEVHGGRTWVESKPGDGATFWVSLPSVLIADHPI